MTINLENLPPAVQFIYIAMTRSVIYFKEMGENKNFFLAFCDEIWNSMELTDCECLKDTLEGYMKKNMEPYVESYIKNQSQKDG